MKKKYGPLTTRLVVALIAVFFMGCSGNTTDDAESAAGIQLSVPAPIRQVLAIDPSQLNVELKVNNRTFATTQSAGRWTATVMVPSGTNSTVTVVWTELFNNTRIKLAEQSVTTFVGTSGKTIDIGDDYITQGNGFDVDRDGYSNLDERTQGTDPLVESDRPDASTLNLTVLIPDDVLALQLGFTVSATSNGSNVILQKTDNQYSAVIPGLVADSTANIEVEVKSIEYSGLILATAQRAITVSQGGENMLTINAGDFDTSMDADNDGDTNLRELVRGRNPTQLADFSVPRVATPPLIDGRFSDAVWRGILGQPDGLLINRLITADETGFETQDGLRSDWKAVADAEYLYIAIRILDSSTWFDSGVEWWKDDGVELFFDGDNSKLPDYDGINDFHMNFRAEDVSVIKGARSVALPENMLFELSTDGFDSDISGGIFPSDINQDGQTDIGFNLEISIPLAEIDVELNQPFGINVHFNDDDNGGERDAKFVWIGELGLDRDYLDPSSMGTALIRD